MAVAAFAMTFIPAPQKFHAGAREIDRELVLLIKAVALGDQDALSKLYDLTHRAVFGLTLRVLGNASTAEEVTLDVYVQVWKQAHHYNTDRAKPVSWLLMMARTRAIDRLRNSRHIIQESESLESVFTIPTAAEDPEDLSIFAEQRRIIRAALEGLSFDQRQAIELAYFHGLSQSEIAERLKVPLGTVKTRMRGALMKLRHSLKNSLD